MKETFVLRRRGGEMLGRDDKPTYNPEAAWTVSTLQEAYQRAHTENKAYSAEANFPFSDPRGWFVEVLDVGKDFGSPFGDLRIAAVMIATVIGPDGAPRSSRLAADLRRYALGTLAELDSKTNGPRSRSAETMAEALCELSVERVHVVSRRA